MRIFVRHITTYNYDNANRLLDVTAPGINNTISSHQYPNTIILG